MPKFNDYNVQPDCKRKKREKIEQVVHKKGSMMSHTLNSDSIQPSSSDESNPQCVVFFGNLVKKFYETSLFETSF